jgi:DnaJ family protein C protein 3
MQFTEKAAEADTWCTKALRHEGSNEDALYYRAQARMALEQYQEAMDDLNRGLEGNQQSQRLHDAHRRVQRLLKQSQRKDYYKILGIPRTANKKEIKKAYRAQAQLFHPDKYRGDLTPQQVERKMAEVNSAYEVLSNDELKARFDSGEDPNDPQQGGGGGGGPFHHGFHPGGHAFQGDPFQHFGGGGGSGGSGGGGGGYQFHFRAG